jgi:hypothetical protein
VWAWRLTSQNWHNPSSPRAVTTSRSMSLETYSCTMLMSAERNGVSCRRAMVMQPQGMKTLIQRCGVARYRVKGNLFLYIVVDPSFKSKSIKKPLQVDVDLDQALSTPMPAVRGWTPPFTTAVPHPTSSPSGHFGNFVFHHHTLSSQWRKGITLICSIKRPLTPMFIFSSSRAIAGRCHCAWTHGEETV